MPPTSCLVGVGPEWNVRVSSVRGQTNGVRHLADDCLACGGRVVADSALPWQRTKCEKHERERERKRKGNGKRSNSICMIETPLTLDDFPSPFFCLPWVEIRNRKHTHISHSLYCHGIHPSISHALSLNQ